MFNRIFSGLAQRPQARPWPRSRKLWGHGLWALALACLNPHSGQAAEKVIHVLDLRPVLADTSIDSTYRYDLCKAIGALQGIVNRGEPRLFLIALSNSVGREINNPQAESVDAYWLRHLSWPGRLLGQHRQVPHTDPFEVFAHFASDIKGLALWDEQVPATANVASSAAGARDLLPVRKSSHEQSFHQVLLERLPKLTIGLDLSGKFPLSGEHSTGSAKNDAYRWAIDNMLATEELSPLHAANYVDGIAWNSLAPGAEQPYPDLANAGIFNADYWVAKRAFFYDLGVWDDLHVEDEPEAPAGMDYQTLTMLFGTMNRLKPVDKFFISGGFIPWWLKYSNADWNGRDNSITPHGPVLSEWRQIAVTTAFNGMLDADAFGLVGLANASVYMHVPLDPRYKQSDAYEPQTRFAPDTTYLLFGMLDYDSASWLAQAHQAIWSDPKRGELPLLWGINPILAERVPMVFDSLYATRTANDTIGMGEGSGYINPLHLLGEREFSSLPSARDAYVDFSRALAKQFDMRYTTFVIPGTEPLSAEAIDMMAAVTPYGVGVQGQRVQDGLYGETPFIAQLWDLNWTNSPEAISKRLEMQIGMVRGHWALDAPGLTGGFVFNRCILVRPSTLVAAVEDLRQRRSDLNFKVVSPHDFYRFAKQVYQSRQK